MVRPLSFPFPSFVLPLTTTPHHRFTCSCCPPNVSRLLSSLGNYLCSLSLPTPSTPALEIAIHQFVASRIQLDFDDGKPPATMVVETEYPLEGQVKISFEKLRGRKVGVRMRVPAWVGEERWSVRCVVVLLASVCLADLKRFVPCLFSQLTQHSSPLAPSLTKGYLYLPSGSFNPLSPLLYTLPLTPKTVLPHPLVSQNVGKVAFQRGPVLYALESVDHPGLDFRLIRVPREGTGPLKEWERYALGEELSPGRRGGEVRWGLKGWGRKVCLEQGREGEGQEVELRMVPYAVWGNRGVGDLVVWMGRD